MAVPGSVASTGTTPIITGDRGRGRGRGGSRGGSRGRSRGRGRARGRQGELRHQHRVGQYVAFHGQDADGGEEQYIGQVEALMGTLSTGPKYRVNYFDAAEDDVGGCYSYKVCSNPEDRTQPWQEVICESDVLSRVEWVQCDRCDNHMGDDQWLDAIEEIFNSAFKERHEEVDSDDEYLI